MEEYQQTAPGGDSMDALFGKTIGMLSAVLDFRSERHKVITSNIANIDTPHYRPKDLVFTEELKEMIESGERVTMTGSREGHLSGKGDPGEAVFEVVEAGERVDLDSEMAKLAENNLMYNLAVELLARKFKGLNTVLREAK
jgi:flagellar basal-body rod protein FlgB